MFLQIDKNLKSGMYYGTPFRVSPVFVIPLKTKGIMQGLPAWGPPTVPQTLTIPGSNYSDGHPAGVTDLGTNKESQKVKEEVGYRNPVYLFIIY